MAQGMTGGFLSTNFLINFFADTAGIRDAERQLASMQRKIQSMSAFGKDVRITGIQRIGTDANGATIAVLKLENALTRVKGTATLATSPGGQVGTPGPGYQWSAKSQQWYKKGARGAQRVDPIYAQGPIVAQYSTEVQKASVASMKAAKATDAHKSSMIGLAGRALTVIPIWMALRGLYMGLFSSIGDLVKTYMDLDVQMARVSTVTRGSIEDVKGLKEEVITYSSSASRGYEEAAKAMYALGSAGLTVTQQMAGMKHIMDLSIGTFGETEQIAKLVAGSFNVFGASLKGAITDSQRFKQISDILAYTYSTQQVELSEIANAMTFVASIASLVDIEFNELVTTIGVLNTGMLKGSKSGTALMNAFVQLATKGKKLGDLGVVFDPSKPLDFMNIMEQLHNIYGSQALSLTNLKEIMETFGRRGGRAAAQLIADFDRWQNSIGDAKANFEDFAEFMKEKAEVSLPAAWNKLWNSIKGGFLTAVGEQDFLVKIMDKKTQRLIAQRYYDELKDILPPEFSTLQLNLIPGPSLVLAKGKEAEIIAVKEANAELFSLYKQRGKEEIRAKEEIEELMKKGELFPDEGREELIEIEERLLEIIKKVSKEKLNELDIRKEMINLIEKDEILSLIAAKSETEKAKLLSVILEIYKKINQTKKEDQDITDVKDRATQKEFDDLDRKFKYQKLVSSGVEKDILSQVKIRDLIKLINVEVLKQNENQEHKVNVLDIQEISNQERLYEIAKHIGTAKKYVFDLYKEINETEKQNIELIEKYSKTLKDSFEGGFADFLKGEQDIGDVFKGMSKTFGDNAAEAMSEAIGDVVFDNIDLGGQFGGIMATMRNLFRRDGNKQKGAFDYHYSKMIKFADYHTNRLYGVMGGGGPGGGGGLGQVFSYVGSYGASQGYEVGGAWPGGGGTTGTGGNFLTRKRAGLGGLSLGTVGGMFGSSALAYGAAGGGGAGAMGAVGSAALGVGMLGGFSQALLAGGFMNAGAAGMMGSGIGLGTAGGGIMGGIGGVLAAIPVWGWLALGAGLLVGSMLMKKDPEFRREEMRDQTSQIASRIDVTNNHLEWVNRNLVALRQELTYIMPQSFYFSQRDESEEFGVGAQRGAQ